MQTVNHEALRILVADIGYTETSARTGFKRDTLYKWGQRKGWKTPIEHAQSKAVQSVQSPSIAHANALSDLEKRTKLSLAKSAAHMAIQSESAPLAQAGNVHKAAQTAALVHKWGQEQGQAAFSLNVLNLGGSVQIGVKADSVDAVAQPQGLVDSSETD